MITSFLNGWIHISAFVIIAAASICVLTMWLMQGKRSEYGYIFDAKIYAVVLMQAAILIPVALRVLGIV